MKQPTLYYVHHEGEEYHNCDLFVNADTPEQAVDIWREHCRENDWPLDTHAPITAWELMSIGSLTGAIDWTEIPSFTYSA